MHIALSLSHCGKDGILVLVKQEVILRSQNVENFPSFFESLEKGGCLMCEFLPSSPDDEQLATMCAFVRKFCDQNYHGQPFGYLG